METDHTHRKNEQTVANVRCPFWPGNDGSDSWTSGFRISFFSRMFHFLKVAMDYYGNILTVEL